MKRLAFAILLCLVWSELALAAITVDAVTISGGTGDFGSDTFSHTVAADANMLVVCTSTTTGAGNSAVTAVTYNGDALTQLVTASTANRAEVWYRLAPDTGVHDVVVTAPTDPWFVYTAISLKGVDQVTPTNTATLASTTDDQNAAITITSAAGEFVIDCATIANDPVASVGAGQTQRTNVTHDFDIWAGVSTMAGASPNVVPDWTLDGDYGVGHVAVSLAPLAVAAPSGGRRFVDFH